MADPCPTTGGPTCDTVRGVRERLSTLETIVSEQLRHIDESLRELRPIARGLIEMRGAHDRLSDAVLRIGKQVDRHEARLDIHSDQIKAAAIAEAGLLPKVTRNEAVIRGAIGVLCSVATAFVIYLLQRSS